MNNKRPYGKAFATTVQRKPFRPFPQNTAPMVLYRTPSQYKSLTNPPQGRLWPEKKAITQSGSIGILGPGQWSEIDFLNPCANGAADGNRVGRKTQLKSILVRWNDSSNCATQPIRILMVYDRAPELTLPLIGEIVGGTGFNSPMNLGNADRFVVLADEMIPSVSANSRRAGTIYKKLNLPSVFNSTTGTIDDITTGAIFIMCCFPAAVAGEGIGYVARTRYTDM